jgi:hypothetical protein
MREMGRRSSGKNGFQFSAARFMGGEYMLLCIEPESSLLDALRDPLFPHSSRSTSRSPGRQSIFTWQSQVIEMLQTLFHVAVHDLEKYFHVPIRAESFRFSHRPQPHCVYRVIQSVKHLKTFIV